MNPANELAFEAHVTGWLLKHGGYRRVIRGRAGRGNPPVEVLSPFSYGVVITTPNWWRTHWNLKVQEAYRPSGLRLFGMVKSQGRFVIRTPFYDSE